MAWNDLGEPMPDHRDELLARVVRRGELLRRRRRVVWGAAALSSVLAVVVPATVWSRDDNSRARVVSASEGQAYPETFADTGGTADGTTMVPDATVLEPDTTTVTSPPATAPRATTTTAPAPPGPAPLHPTVPPPSLGGDQPGGEQQLPPCTAADLEVAVTTDKPSYGPGEVVKVTGTLRNSSSQTCTYGSTTHMEVRDSAGTVVYAGGGHADYIAGQEPKLAPGESGPTLPMQWDQQTCAEMSGCKPALPGDYTVTVDVGYGSAVVPVTIRPA